MLPISHITQKIIATSPFIEEALYDGLINISALARKIKPEVEMIAQKPVTESSIVMAINRMTISEKRNLIKGIKDYLKNIGDVTVRSDISVCTFTNSHTLSKNQTQLMEKVEEDEIAFCTFSQGISERTIILNKPLKPLLIDIFKHENLISEKNDLSAITIRLPINNTEYSGVYYYILKQLAWEDISIVEVISTTNEFTLVIDKQHIEKCFSLMMSLKS